LAYSTGDILEGFISLAPTFDARKSQCRVIENGLLTKPAIRSSETARIRAFTASEISDGTAGDADIFTATT